MNKSKPSRIQQFNTKPKLQMLDKHSFNHHGMKNPVHVEPYHIPYIYNLMIKGEKLMITPKVDGLNKYLSITGTVLEVEHIKDTNTYYVIDVKPDRYDKSSLSDRLLGLKSINRLAVNSFIEITDTNVEDIMKHINDKTNYVELFNKSNVFTKPIFNIRLQSLENIKTLICMMFNKYNTVLFKNDGWILYTDSLTPFKIKHIDDLTIDLKYFNGKLCAVKCQNSIDKTSSESLVPVDISNVHQEIFPKSIDISSVQSNSVYRILPVLKGELLIEYESVELRTDKVVPNKISTVRSIFNRLKNNWIPESILTKYEECENIYYQHQNQHNHYRDVLEMLRKEKRRIIIEALESKTENMKVFDFGCGNGSVSQLFGEYYGIDRDPVILGSNTNSNINLIWGDPNLALSEIKHVEFFTSFIKDGCLDNIDVFLSINSIHYFDLNCLNQLMNMTKSDCSSSSSAANSTKFVVYSMFSERIDSAFIDNKLTFGNDFYIEKNESGHFTFRYPWRTDTFSECLYSKTEFIHVMNNLGWNVIKEIRNESDSFIALHDLIVLEKSQ